MFVSRHVLVGGVSGVIVRCCPQEGEYEGRPPGYWGDRDVQHLDDGTNPVFLCLKGSCVSLCRVFGSGTFHVFMFPPPGGQLWPRLARSQDQNLISN